MVLLRWSDSWQRRPTDHTAVAYGRRMAKRRSFMAAAALALIAAAPVAVADRATLAARWAEPASRFAVVDGVRLHYVLEGKGSPVVLLNASYMGLQAWRPVAERLAARHRVLRLDFPISGLSGPEPDGRYSIDRHIELLDALTRRLGLDRFALVGTSSGGIVAFRYAGQAPARVSRLVLIGTAGLPRTATTDPLRGRRASDGAGPQPRDVWQANLAANFGAPERLPAWLVDLAYDLNRREGLASESASFLKTFRTGDPRRELARVTAPTLILWGEANATVSPLEADVVEHWMTAAPTLTRKYPGIGHYPYVEAPGRVAADLEAFLSGKLDGELRVTARLKPR
jgi:pimeloyl-ACP methyl ester carboxylesterase